MTRSPWRRFDVVSLTGVLVFLSLVQACGSRRADMGSPPPSGSAAPTAGDTTFPEPAVNGMPSLGTIAVNVGQPSTAIAANFVGLSLEWSNGLRYLGSGETANPVTIQLLKNFAEDGHRIDLRIGGNSSDRSWWTVGPGTRPEIATASVTATHLSTFRSIHDQTGARFIIGLNLAANDPTNPASFVEAVRAALPPEAITAFEIGNEPDLYSENGRRPTTFQFSDYVSETQRYVDALAPLVGPAPRLVVPALARKAWFPMMAEFMARNQGNLALATLHNYPLTTCGKQPTDPTYPKPVELLTDRATAGVGNGFVPMVEQARQASLALRIGEFNTAACGGAAGASDVFATALWAPDALFRLAQAGAVGVDFHTSGFYAAYSYSDAVLSVKPLYYGMKFFSLASAHGGRLLPVQITGSTARVRAFATLGDDGITRIAILNQDENADGAVTVSLSQPRGEGVVARLTGSSLTASTGITLEGRTFDGSPDGKPVAGKAVGVLAPNGTNYTLALPRLSGVILAVSPSAQR